MLRRRLLLKDGDKGKYVDNGLVVWYDGKNNLKGDGYSTTSYCWYPHAAENTTILDGCYLEGNGTPTWLVNGGFNDPSSSSPNNFGQRSKTRVFTYNTTPIYDFTWIIHVNVKKSDLGDGNFVFLGQTYLTGGTGSYQFRSEEGGRIFTMAQYTGSDWINCKVSGNSTPDIIRTLAFVRSGSTLTVYVNGQLFGSATGCSTTALIYEYGPAFRTAGYDKDTPDFIGDFYGCVCYRRALSTTEVKNMTNYLEYRYTEVNPNGYDYVDLGLPSGTKWATMNVGASSETDYGNYYQYGKGAAQYAETSGNSNYPGKEDPLDPYKDTAAQVWGGSWHMPTKEQMQELRANTPYQWVTNYKGSGIRGGLFTAQNGNSVFFPAAGRWNNGSQSNVGLQGFYWSSSPSGNSYAYRLSFNYDSSGVGYVNTPP